MSKDIDLPEDDQDYQTGFWKEGVSEDNISALADITENLAARLDLYRDEYEAGNISSDRVRNVMKLGKRAIEAEERMMVQAEGDPEGYYDPEIFDEDLRDEAEEKLDEYDIEPDNIDLEAEGYRNSQESDIIINHDHDPETRLWDSQRRYLQVLDEIKNFVDVEVIEPDTF